MKQLSLVVLLWACPATLPSTTTGAAIEDIAFCGDCYCIPEAGQTCPTDSMPQVNFSAQFLSNLRGMTLENPINMTCNPFDENAQEPCVTHPPLEVGVACAINISAPANTTSQCPGNYNYTLVTVSSLENINKNLILTHEGACGVCSTLQDLAMYIETPDLTSAGITCAIRSLINETAGIECYMEVGFSKSCATLWTYHGMKTTQECGSICSAHAFSGEADFGPAPTCTLAKCLQCDQLNTREVFEQYGGRTPPRSGILSGLIRNCSEIAPIDQKDPCNATTEV